MYERATWDHPSGGCWVVSRAADKGLLDQHPPASLRKRSVFIDDMVSCFVVRDAAEVEGALELTTVYFEDPKFFSAKVINAAVKGQMWEACRSYIGNFRTYSAGAGDGPRARGEGEEAGRPAPAGPGRAPPKNRLQRRLQHLRRLNPFKPTGNAWKRKAVLIAGLLRVIIDAT